MFFSLFVVVVVIFLYALINWYKIRELKTVTVFYDGVILKALNHIFVHIKPIKHESKIKKKTYKHINIQNV